MSDLSHNVAGDSSPAAPAAPFNTPENVATLVALAVGESAEINGLTITRCDRSVKPTFRYAYAGPWGGSRQVGGDTVAQAAWFMLDSFDEKPWNSKDDDCSCGGPCGDDWCGR